MPVPSPVPLGVLFWLFRTFVSSVICLLIGFFGIKVLDLITVKIKEFKVIRGNAEATALYVGGFLIFAGLVVHGSALNPFFLGQWPTFSAFFGLQRLLIILLSVAVSFLIGWLFYLVFAKFTPMGVDLDDINQSPIAVGAFLFCYEVFMGLVIHASLTVPL